ncbi:MAG: hypothetical protein CM1200mP10_28880 [Candidatus Neomarinimicrobiota bacterium]|nr:MAG: hypothetical protein CM1200mP10_28880 [Candidatus Neomarinimicrobiota bacterium]
MNEAKRLCALLMMTDDIRSQRISIKDEINNTINNTLGASGMRYPDFHMT